MRACALEIAFQGIFFHLSSTRFCSWKSCTSCCDLDKLKRENINHRGHYPSPPKTLPPYKASIKKHWHHSPTWYFSHKTYLQFSLFSNNTNQTLTNLHSVNNAEKSDYYYPSLSNSWGLNTFYILIISAWEQNVNNKYANIWRLLLRAQPTEVPFEVQNMLNQTGQNALIIHAFLFGG